MSKAQEIEKAWDRCKEIERAIQAELKSMRGKPPTQHYKNLKADADKARAEYERLKGGGFVDPLDPAKGDKYTHNKVLRAFLGKEGADSHTKLEY